MYAKEVIEEAREEIELIHNLTRGEDRHPRLTPIKELRAVENGCAIFYQSNFGNLKGMKKVVVSANIVMLAKNRHCEFQPMNRISVNFQRSKQIFEEIGIDILDKKFLHFRFSLTPDLLVVFLVVHNESANPTSYHRFHNNIHKGGHWKKTMLDYSR